jgi:hypothetical protein
LQVRSDQALQSPSLLASLWELDHLERVRIAGPRDLVMAGRLSQIPSLKVLEVQEGRVGFASLAQFDRSNLEALSLRRTKVDASLLGELAEGWIKLSELDLGYTGVTADGLERLKQRLPIAHLDLDGNALTSKEVDALVALYTDWREADPRLNFTLRITRSEIQDEDFERLKGAGVDVFYGRPLSEIAK